MLNIELAKAEFYELQVLAPLKSELQSQKADKIRSWKGNIIKNLEK